LSLAGVQGAEPLGLLDANLRGMAALWAPAAGDHMDMIEEAVRAANGLALFLDMDGTLIEFATTPDAVKVPDDLVPALAGAARRVGGALALLSGRSIAELDRLTAPLELPASGLHGGEIRTTLEGPTQIVAHHGLPARVRPDLARLLRNFPAAMLEEKGLSVAVHYRGAPALGAELGNALLRYVTGGEVTGVELMAGELVYELKPAGFDKGGSLRHFMDFAPFVGRKPVFVSDHPIDQAGFDAAGALGGFGISVGRQIPGAACSLPDPTAVRAWLRHFSGDEWPAA
jgi:trehalose 6-phosphate phosphatase